MSDPKPQPQPQPFKVIIVGAGIAGLTLANALQKAPVDIEYVILEAYGTIAPQLGAGIVLLPNGSRILDQLGVYPALARQTQEVGDSGVYDANGTLLIKERSDTGKLVGARMGYPLSWCERRTIVKTLMEHLDHSKGTILTNKRVSRVQQSEKDGATVFCTDGSSYHGDVVVGADGVHSAVRNELWRTLEERGYRELVVRQIAMTAEYKCLFGMSKPVAGMEPGSTDDTWGKDVSTVTSIGPGGTIYWFLFERMPRIYQAGEMPRFTTEDAVKFAQDHRKVPIRSGGEITFGLLWDRREVATLLPLEESAFTRWSVGRIICMGDSIHKMTPHTGTGGMLAIETAAGLANTFVRLVKEAHGKSPPSTHQVETALRQHESIFHARAAAKVKAAGDLARLATLRNFKHRLIVKFLLPIAVDSRVDQICDIAMGAPLIEYLPIPPRSTKGTTPFNPSHGFGTGESPWVRAATALPLLIMAFAALKIMFTVAPIESILDILDRGVYRSGGAEFHIMNAFYHFRPLDNFSRSGVLRFIVSGEHFFYQTFSFFADYGVWYAIMLLESARRANQLTPLGVVLFWGMLNMWGIGIFGPVYQFVHYVATPISSLAALDMRLTDISYTSTVLPVILATHFATYVDAYLLPNPSHRQMAAYLWELFPVWAFLAQEVAVRYILPESTVQKDRLANVKRDIPVIRATIGVLCAITTGIWQYTIWYSGQSLADIFLPFISADFSSFSFEQLFHEFLKWDQVFFAAGNIFWVAIFIWDLKAAGMIRESWLRLAVYGGLLHLIGGNGTMLGLAWLYREHVLATRRHKTAVVSG